VPLRKVRLECSPSLFCFTALVFVVALILGAIGVLLVVWPAQRNEQFINAGELQSPSVVQSCQMV
jgi:hypothetical protein